MAMAVAEAGEVMGEEVPVAGIMAAVLESTKTSRNRAHPEE